jgi:hypothetical protein
MTSGRLFDLWYNHRRPHDHFKARYESGGEAARKGSPARNRC